MSRKLYGRTSLTGGTTEDLDGINGAVLNDGDITLVGVEGVEFSPYILDADSGLSESSPNIISPDTNPGSKRWIYLPIAVTSSRALTEASLQGSSRVTLSDTGLSCYNSSSNKTVHIKNDGTFTINQYGHLDLIGSVSSPAYIYFNGTYDFVIGQWNSDIVFCPLSDGVGTLYLGTLTTEGGIGNTYRYDIISARAKNYLHLTTGLDNSSVDEYKLTIQMNNPTQSIYMGWWDKSNFYDIYFKKDVFYPGATNSYDLGAPSYNFDDLYIDDVHESADFYFMDDLNDIELIKSIKSSEKIDPRTGLTLIDDDSIPEILLSKDRNTGEILYCEPYIDRFTKQEEPAKPYISDRTIKSLLIGCIKKLDERVELLEKIIEEKI